MQDRDGRLRREHDSDDQFASIIYLRKGISISPLDKLIMEVSVFSAGIVASSRQLAAAKALIKFLASPSAWAAIVNSGLEPMSP